MLWELIFSLYVMGDHIQFGGQTIHEVSKSLDKIKAIKNQYTALPIDSAIIGNELLIMNNAKAENLVILQKCSI